LTFKILLILFLCGLVGFSVVLEYRASAAVRECPHPKRQPRGECLPVIPPPCERPEVLPDCSVLRPLLRVSCAHAWRERLIGDVIRSPQSLCVVFERDKLKTVAMVSTLDIMRAMGR